MTVDDERVSDACPHRQQERMMRGFPRLVHTDRQQKWMMCKSVKVDDVRGF